MNVIVIVIVVIIVIIAASLINLAIQVRKARAEEARASWSASPWGQAQTSRSQAEKVWKLAFKEYYNRTGGDFSVACQHADAAAEVYFKAAHASEELARKASSSAVRKDTEGRLKG